MADLTNQQLLDILRLEFVTKQDLKAELGKFASKDDLKEALENYPTKQDLKKELKKFATKKDLERFATKEELNSGFDRLARKLDNHSRASTQHHLRILKETGNINQELTKLTESQEGIDKRFNRLKIVTE